MRKQSLFALLAILILSLTMMACVAEAFIQPVNPRIMEQNLRAAEERHRQQHRQQQVTTALVIFGVVALFVGVLGYEYQKKKRHEEIVREIKNSKG